MSQIKQIVLVKWEDAVSNSQWQPAADAKSMEPHIIHTAGILLKKDEKHVVLALNNCKETGNVADVMQIPRGMVRSIKRVGSFKP